MCHRRRWFLPLLIACVVAGSRCALAQTSPADFEADPMYGDPKIEVPPAVNLFDPALPSLWLAALGRPDVDTRQQAAEAIATALRMGMAHLDGARQPLMELLHSPNPLLQLAAANALIGFDDPTLGAPLMAVVSATNDDPELQLAVDPALAQWKTPGAAEMFLKRLTATDARTQGRLSAVISLGVLKSPTAAMPLRSVVIDPSSPITLRLAAAKALSQVAPPTLDATARELLTDHPPMLNRLLAATLLASASGSSAQTILLTLVQDEEPAVVTIAAQRLFEMDPHLLAPFTALLFASSDNTVRITLAKALLVEHTPAAAETLLKLLNDPSLLVRGTARAALTTLDADAPLRPMLRAAAIELVATQQPHAVAQAFDYLASVNETSVADNAVARLDDPSLEVRIAAIIALRHFGLPDTLDAQRQRMQTLLRKANQKGISEKDAAVVDEELAQLVENVGISRDEPSEAFLRNILPMKSSPLLKARIAAAWSLGKMNAGKSNKSAISALRGRIQDKDAQHPESPEVQAMAVVGVGLMEAAEGLAVLPNDGSGAKMDAASHWARSQITHQPLIPTPPFERTIRGWFIEPLN